MALKVRAVGYCLQLVVVALAVMVWQMDLIRRVAGQRMACFSVFIALPSATLRTMATAPCQVTTADDVLSSFEWLQYFKFWPLC